MIYAFDEADADLTLMPMASRRALDATGLKLSLTSYQTLGVADRRELVRLGAESTVDVDAVSAIVRRAGGAPSCEVPKLLEPVELPDGLVHDLAPHQALDAARWSRLTGLDRYVLDKLQRRGRLERLRAAYDEIVRR